MNGAGDDEVYLPRSQSGSSPQHLLITLLGDYWLTREELLPSAALVALIEEFGVTDVGARAALSRLARRGLLESRKVGRRTFYGLNRGTARRVIAGSHRIMSFGTNESWNGTWTVLVYSLPEDRRELRHVLRSRMRWLGFAPLYDGVWVSPTADVDDTTGMLKELQIETCTVFTATDVVGVGRPPTDAWDLVALRETYDEFIADCRKVIGLLERGDTSPAKALHARTAVMDAYRRFPGLDPGLPAQLMPHDWPRSLAREVFVAAYDGLAPLAELRARQIVAAFDPELAELVRCHLSTEVMAGDLLTA